MRKSLPLSWALGACVAAFACGGGDDGTGPGPQTPIGSVTVTPDEVTIELGDTIRLEATVRDRFERVLTDREVTWETGDPDVARVDDSGLVTGLDAGTVSITAIAEDRSDDATVTVVGPVAVVDVTPDSAVVLLGEPRQLQVVVLDEAGTPRGDRPVTWASTDPSVATVDDSGLVSGVAVGTAYVTATSDGVVDSTFVDVREPLMFADLTAGCLDADCAVRGTNFPNHACGITTDGEAFCWGSDANGRLAVDVSGVFTNEPVQVPKVAGLESITAGDTHTCARSDSDQARCWGRNDRGQIGDGTTADRAAPTAVSGGLSFVGISAGGDHTCGVTSSGDAYCWGANDRGQLGDGTTTDRMSPVLVSGGLTWAEVSAGGGHTCAVTTGNVAYCWGANDRGQLGDGTTTDRNDPTIVGGGLSFVSVTAGLAHSCAVTTSDEAYCWGANGEGQLGDGTRTDRSQPALVTGGLAFSSVSAGVGHTCGVLIGSGARCWGDNEAGQLGDGTLTDRTEPVAPSEDLPFVQVSAGGSFSCALTPDPTGYCWGLNETGQLGSGAGGGPLPPVLISLPTRIAGQLSNP